MNPEFQKEYQDAIKFLESDDVDKALKDLGIEDEDDEDDE